MARRRRPGRTLLGFFVGLAVAYGLVALTGTWTLLLQVTDLHAALLMTFPLALAICVAVRASRRPERAE